MTSESLEMASELIAQIAAAAKAGDALALGPQAVKNLHGLLGDLLRSSAEPPVSREQRIAQLQAEIREHLTEDEPLGEHRTGCDSQGYVNRNGFLVCSGCGKTAGEIFEAAHRRALNRQAEPNGEVPTDGQLLDQLQDAFYKADSGYVEQDIALRRDLANLLVRYNRNS